VRRQLPPLKSRPDSAASRAEAATSQLPEHVPLVNHVTAPQANALVEPELAF